MELNINKVTPATRPKFYGQKLYRGKEGINEACQDTLTKRQKSKVAGVLVYLVVLN
ncbi:MAG TPA: hypothetical protein VGB37_13385 [Candidatus Lokiarchaeia archaeon]